MSSTQMIKLRCELLPLVAYLLEIIISACTSEFKPSQGFTSGGLFFFAFSSFFLTLPLRSLPSTTIISLRIVHITMAKYHFDCFVC
jgi:hypothetical protein